MKHNSLLIQDSSGSSVPGSLINIKGINLEDVLIAICVNQLPSTPEWAVFKNSLLNNTELTKTIFYTQCSSFARNEECRSSAQLQTPSTPTTAPSSR